MPVTKRVIVRAVTYFAGRINSFEDALEETERALHALNSIEEKLMRAGYEVFTKRISFGGISPGIARRLVDEVPRNVLISIGYTRNLDAETVIELVSNGIYTPIVHPGDPDLKSAYRYSEIIHNASRINPEYATRISIGFHSEDFATPYFPDSSSSGVRRIGLAFIYSHVVSNGIKAGKSLDESFKQAVEQINNVVETVKGSISLPVYVDYSLSPWMDKSVAEIYELLGCRLTELCVPYYTWLLNRYISRIAHSDLSIGFNEVMLPYAEDNVLISYGARGLVRARDFLLFASTCVAGVDMIVVPWGPRELAYMIASTMAIKHAKNRPLSLRAIPVNANPGDIIDLGRFGKIPVLSY